jgi:hypothetical protein
MGCGLLVVGCSSDSPHPQPISLPCWRSARGVHNQRSIRNGLCHHDCKAKRRVLINCSPTIRVSQHPKSRARSKRYSNPTLSLAKASNRTRSPALPALPVPPALSLSKVSPSRGACRTGPSDRKCSHAPVIGNSHPPLARLEPVERPTSNVARTRRELVTPATPNRNAPRFTTRLCSPL